MKYSFRLAVVGIAALSLGITGCGLDQHPAYSPAIKYGLRQDPVIKGPVKDLGEERFDPDRPGVFPIMKFDDMYKPDHPYLAKSKDLPEKVLRDPTKIQQKDRDVFEAELEKMFGTPARPTVNAKEAGIDEAAIADLKLDDATLATGSTRYRIHCLHCHGVPGDGRGPTARWINPHPRDFRAGLFKFQSVDQTVRTSRPPSRADLLRTLRQGIENTAMPSFNLLHDAELESLVSYVIHLSLRGKVEQTLFKNSFELDGKSGVLKWAGEDDIPTEVKFYTKKFATEGWLESNKSASAVKVAVYPFEDNDPDFRAKYSASVKRGQELFNATPSDEFKKEYRERIYKEKFPELVAKAGGNKEEAEKSLDAHVLSKLTAIKCVSCHTDYGRQAKFRYDEWGTLVRPNNLSQGNLRGGKRPVDVYYRIHSGIPGSEMTPFGAALDPGQEVYLWDLVNFVTVLPYPTMRDSLKIKID